MPPLPYPVYLDHIRSESARFRSVLAECDPTAQVPSCPEWSAADLLSHLTGVQWFWEQVLRGRPAPPADDLQESRPPRPEAFSDLLGAFDAQSASFLAVLADADPDEPAWHWLSGGQSVGTSYRRQAHEALIHRLDAEQVAAAVTPLDPALAADGVHEALDWMYGGEPPPWAPFTSSGGLVAVRAEDTGATLLVEPGSIAGTSPEGRSLEGAHLIVRETTETIGATETTGATAVATVSGTAGDLDAWLWHRVGDDAVRLEGDPEVLAAFRAAVSPALD